MRIPRTVCLVLALLVTGVGPNQQSQLISSEPAPRGLELVDQSQPARRAYSVYFPDVPVAADAEISFVRVVLSCARVVSITRIPDDWYVQTLRPDVQAGPEWSDFQFASNAVEFAAGHGVSRLRSLRLLDGAVRIEVEGDRCFDITADVGDDLGIDWRVRLPRTKLQLRR